MLLTKTITKSEEMQVEIKTPSFYSKPSSNKKAMICEDGSILIAWGDYLHKTKMDGFGYKSALEEILSYSEISEDEFMAAYEECLKTFEISMFPQPA